jgi:hypothetical protein
MQISLQINAGAKLQMNERGCEWPLKYYCEICSRLNLKKNRVKNKHLQICGRATVTKEISEPQFETF